MKRSQVLLVSFALLLGIVTNASAQAPSLNTQTWSNGGTTITFTTPFIYGNCPMLQTSDRIYTTGVPSNWVLQGYVRLAYILGDGGREELQTYWINTYGNLNLTILYPPVGAWPTFIDSFGQTVAEMHVDSAIAVYDSAGALVTWVGGDQANAPGILGPLQDWDVFCFGLPPGGSGCTPGFWKQGQHFSAWPAEYSPVPPATSFELVFGRDVPGNPTLLSALQTGGGGLTALMRHSAAAVLSAASFDYGLTVKGVILAFQAAFDNGDYETTANSFDYLNNQGCPFR